MYTNGIWWCSEKRFEKILSKEEIEEQIEKAIIEENYELAEQLKHKL